MRYDFSKMSADAFELMVRSLNEKIFGVRCEQYGLGPDGQREFVFEGSIKDIAGVVFEGRTVGQVKYKYVTTKEDDFTWLAREIDAELRNFRLKETEYIPDNYLFYTNVVLTPAKDTGVKDKIEAYVKDKNDIISNFYVMGYDEICAMLDNNRDVAISYAATILAGDLLMKLLEEYTLDYLDVLKKYLFCEFTEEMYPRLEQADSVSDRKIPLEKVCVDINVTDRRRSKTVKFARRVFELGNEILGYKRAVAECNDGLHSDENFVLIGGPGKGKSTISQFIAQIYRAYSLKALGYRSRELDQFMTEFTKSYGYRIDRIRIAFKVALREYAAWIRRKKQEENHSVLQYMQERMEKFEGNKISAQTIRKMLKEQAWIFFFDGLDEVPESSNRQEVLKQIHLFITLELRDAGCDCMIIGTTREQGYNNDFDEQKYLHMEVAELSKEDSLIYIRKLFAVMEEQSEQRKKYISIMNEALEDEKTGRLMKTPLQVTIIAILVKSGGKPPHDRYSLFRQYYDIMVKREKQKEVVATLNDNTVWLDDIHCMIGYRLQNESEMEQNASAEISREELEKEISSYVKHNQDDFYEKEGRNKEKEAEFLMTITQRICFLNENREGFYSFTIRSMQEFFAGTYLVKGRSDEEAMRNITGIAYSSYWRNVLLFALGYIELERKYLETKIGLLCGQMNGAENITRKEYTSDNVCLFGSWLAVDILTENIFAGKAQGKYIQLAARAMDLYECANYNNFSAITGIQRDRLVCYVKENYKDSTEKIIKSARLYFKLDENEKNDLTQEIIDALSKLEDEHLLMLELEIVKCGDQVKDIITDRLKAALEKGKIKQFLSLMLLETLLYSIKKEDSMELKKNMLLQCLYSSGRNSRLFLKRKKKEMGLACSTTKMFRYFSPKYQDSWGKMVKLTKSIKIQFNDENIDKPALLKIKKEFEKLRLDFLDQFCDFLICPDFEKYQNLYQKLDHEEEFLADKYRLLLERYSKSEIRSAEEFDKMQMKRKNDFACFLQGDFAKMCIDGTNIRFNYEIFVNKNVFQELQNNSKIPFEKLEQLNNVFFKMYLFTAGAAIADKEDPVDEKEADGLIQVLYEAARRNIYIFRENIVIAVLLASRFKGNLWKKIPHFVITDESMEAEFGMGMWSYRKFRLEVFEKAIGSIKSKLICDGKDNGYLALIPSLVTEPVNIRKYISEHTMKELEQIAYSSGISLLAMKILKMCMSENERPGDILDDLFRCAVSRKLIYLELERMLRYCSVRNKEKFWVEMYLRLEDEDFEEKCQIRKRILNDMMEDKCNASKCSIDGSAPGNLYIEAGF